MNGLAAYSARHYVNSYEFVADGNKNEKAKMKNIIGICMSRASHDLFLASS